MMDIMNDNMNDKLLPNQLLKININPIKLINTMCPANMFEYKRIIKANGLIINPINSNGIKAIFIATGTPDIQKMCPQ